MSLNLRFFFRRVEYVNRIFDMSTASMFVVTVVDSLLEAVGIGVNSAAQASSRFFTRGRKGERSGKSPSY